jgi:hypothetical protein
MPNLKENNQYFGKYFERCIVEYVNESGKIVDPTDFIDTNGYNFSEEEIKQLNLEAKKIADYLGHNQTASHIGNHTSIETGDIQLGNQKIEIKRVSAGKGTYHNTSIYYLKKFGFDFKDYMTKFGLYNIIETYFPDITVSRKNNSPVNQSNSSKIRHSNNMEGLSRIEGIDAKIRKEFIKDLTEYFRNNKESAYIFFQDMINKLKINDNEYHCPDRIIIYNYIKDTINELDMNNYNTLNQISNTDFALKLGNLRLQIGWQNGNGLNNPTIRVFLD